MTVKLDLQVYRTVFVLVLNVSSIFLYFFNCFFVFYVTVSMASDPMSLRFDPIGYDSILNPHSKSSDNECNIDKCSPLNCKYFDIDCVNSLVNNKQDISLFHLNTRSLNNEDKANNVINYISSFHNHFDIYGFTESWFKSIEDANLISIEDYNSENCIRENRRGGGASLFIHPKYNYVKRDDLELNCNDCDSVFVELPIERSNIIVGVIYKPQSVDFTSFITELERTIAVANNENKRCYIMGDFNLDLLKHDTSTDIATFINLFYSYNYFPLIDRPTRIAYNEKKGTFSATILDIIFTNDILKNIQSGVITTDLSDHFPMFSITSGNASNSHNGPSPHLAKRCMKPENIHGLKNALSVTDWGSVFTDPNPESSYNNFNTKINNLLNIHCPIKNIKISNRSAPKKPWVTPGIIKSIKAKDKLYKTYLRKPTLQNKIKYQKYRNCLNSLLRISKKSYITTEIENNKFNMKKKLNFPISSMIN